MKTGPKSRATAARERVPLAKIKSNFSRYVREVQARGRSITITQHGRDAAVLAPVAERPKLTVREPLDPQPLGAIELPRLPGAGASAKAIRRALDEERGE